MPNKCEKFHLLSEPQFPPFCLRGLHQDMERVILATLRWDTAAVTPQDFLPHFLACLEERGESSEPELLSMLRRHSDTLASMCACDSHFLGTPPSLVAAAALNCALRGLGRSGLAELMLFGEILAALCQTDVVSPGNAHMQTSVRFLCMLLLDFVSAEINLLACPPSGSASVLQ